MANICSVSMRIVAKDIPTIHSFVEDGRNAKFRVYDGIFTLEEDVNDSEISTENGLVFYDTGFSCAWSFITALREDGVGAMFGKKPEEGKVIIENLCSKHSVAIEAYSEEPGVGFEEHVLINPKGVAVKDECVNMEEYEDEKSERGWSKRGGFGDPGFETATKIYEAE